MTAAGDQQQYEARLLRVLTYIHDNLDGDLSLDTLSDVACMSRFHWHRVFRAMTGETLAEATRLLRLLRAANALVRDPAPLAEIAARHGYPNLTSFSRAFRAAHGASPGAFRKRGLDLASPLFTQPGAHVMYPVTIETLPPIRAAGILHHGPYADLGKAFQTLGGLVAARGLSPHVAGVFAVYHDGPGSKPDSEMRSHAALMTTEGFPQSLEGLDYFDLDGGRYAVLSHKGPPATLAGAYEWLYGQWLPNSGEEPGHAPPIEVYVSDPRTTPADELRTDIRLPLA